MPIKYFILARKMKVKLSLDKVSSLPKMMMQRVMRVAKLTCQMWDFVL